VDGRHGALAGPDSIRSHGPDFLDLLYAEAPREDFDRVVSPAEQNGVAPG
jgi:hypothetical protein